MHRILLKLSGEALAGSKKTGFDEATVREVALQVKELTMAGIQVGIVTGGGNFWRGRTSENIDRTKADQIGMLATVMNCIYVSEIFRSVGMKTPSMDFARRITSASTSTARRTTPVSVEKYGCPVPPAKNTTIPFSKYLFALSFEKSFVKEPHSKGVSTAVFIPTLRKISET